MLIEVNNDNSIACSRCRTVLLFPFKIDIGIRTLIHDAYGWKILSIMDNTPEYLCSGCSNVRNFNAMIDSVFSDSRKGGG